MPQPPIWPAVVAAFVGLAGVVFAFVAFRRAGRAAKLAEDANSRAVIADARAEEAHTILKKRAATDDERTTAELEAPGIADRWLGQLRLSAETAQRAQNKLGSLVVEVSTLAERLAVEAIRAKKKEHHVIEVLLNGEQLILTMWTPYQQNHRRLRGLD
jgi:hypothetical protein